jgi:hypothetical protein
MAKGTLPAVVSPCQNLREGDGRGIGACRATYL